MATHTISDVLYGIVRFRREGITTGEFLLDKSITVANGDLINIVEDYTSDSGTASKTVFTGRVTYVNYDKSQFVQAVDVSDELNQVRPTGTYGGYTEVVLGEIINDASLINVTCAQSSGDMTLLPDADIETGNWVATPLFSKVNDESDLTNITGLAYGHDTLGIANHSLSATYNYIIYKVEVVARAKKTSAGTANIGITLYDGTALLDETDSGDLINGTWANYTATYDDLILTQDDVDNFRVKLRLIANASEIECSQVSVKCYYRYYAGLKKGVVSAVYNLDGNSSIKEILKTLSITELYTWYIDPDLELHFDDGATVSGEAMIVADKMKNIIGNRQVMSYDKVVLYGAYSGGAQISSSRGAGDIIWRDNYLNITEQAALDALADQILVEQGANTVKIQMMRSDSTDGVYQVGETFSIGAVNIKFSGSDRVIPNSTTYILNKIDYIITDGVYNILDIELIDGLLFTTPKNNALGIVQDDAINNATGIAQVGGGESVGEANTASNIGTDGVGVYDSKSGVTLQFRNIAPASAKITVVENGDDIDIDVGDIDSVIEGIITAELAAGESIDQAIDDLIAATYTNGEIDSLDDSHQAAAEATAQAALEATYTNAEIDAMVGAGKDTSAIHDDDSGEISAIAAKDPMAGTDYLIIEDYSDGDAKKSVTGAVLSAFVKAEESLCSTAEAHAYVEATALTLEANLNMNGNNIVTGAGTVDGKDVSGLCTVAEAHAHVEATALTLTEDLTMNGNNILMGGMQIDNVGLYSPLQYDTGGTAGWYKLGTLTAQGSRVTVIAHGVQGYGSQNDNGWAIAQFAFGNADNEFGGSYYCLGQADPDTTFEWVDAGVNTMDCYIWLGTYFRGSVQIIEGLGFTLHSAPQAKLGDPSGTLLTELMTVWSPFTVNGNIAVTGTVDGKDVSGLCTTAEAIQAVEDTGLVMSSTKVITSANEDLLFIFGRADVGYNGVDADVAAFGHIDRTGADSAILQTAAGSTYINCTAGQDILIRRDGTQIASFDSGGTFTVGLVGTGINEFSIDDTLGGDSDDAIPTEQAVKAYVDTQVATKDTRYEGRSSCLCRSNSSYNGKRYYF